MSISPLRLGILLLSASGGVGMVTWAARRPLVDQPQAAVPLAVRTPEIATAHESMTLSSWARRAPFRRSRQPSLVRYDAQTLNALVMSPATSAPQQPTLLLRGLVWGRTPAAIIEGVPSTDGPRLIRAGDSIGPLYVRSISPSQVVVSGLDTTWRLALPRRGP